jgi:hypothetical protein
MNKPQPKAQKAKSADAWADGLKLAKNAFDKWETRGDKIVKRYRDDRGKTSQDKRYNILWSNVRTLQPAIYARKPKAQADRRYKDADPVGRTAAQILERCLQYEIDHYGDYDSALKNSLLDRLLPGRGVAWVRYEQTKAQAKPSDAPADAQKTAPAQVSDDVKAGEDAEAPAELLSECGPVDYVFWKDFRHSPARTWEEVTWVARRVYMAKAEGVERFGEVYEQVPMSHEPIGLEELKKEGATSNLDSMKKGIVWEIWDKPSKTAIWVAEGYQSILDEKADPLELDGFFPCPKPLFATLTTDTLVPVPDYAEYQDQGDEIDTLTARISKLVEAVKVVGLYDASSKAISRLLDEGTDNTMIAVDTWAMFAEKGGIKGAVDFLPLEMVLTALKGLYEAREACKQVIYEITGIADIIRGSSNPNETLGAQEIKANYAGLRLKETQNDVARFASDLLRMKAQIMCAFYRPETLIEMSGIMGTNDAPHAEKAIALLQSDPIRNFKIEVATDSLVEMDERAEQQSRSEFIGAASQFLEKALPAAQAVPEMAPLIGEMLMFYIRSFRAGRPMEAAFEEAVQKLSTKPPEPKQPSEAELKAQGEAQKLQAQQQADAQKAQQEQHRTAAELAAKQQSEALAAEQETQRHAAELAAQQQADERNAMMEMAREQMKQEREDNREAMRQQGEQFQAVMQDTFARWKEELAAAVKIETANIASKAKVANEATTTATREVATEVKP